VDLVIDQDDLDKWLAAQSANQDLFDGLNIGVVLKSSDPKVADRVRQDLAKGQDVDTLTSDELAAARQNGGAAAAVDEARDKKELANKPKQVPTPAARCVSMPSNARRLPDSVVVYFACQGDEPIARPEYYRVASTLDEQERIEAALGLLASPSQKGIKAGLYSVLGDSAVGNSSGLIRGVEVTRDVTTVDFASQLASLGFDRSIAASTMFLEQVVSTVLANGTTSQVRLTLEGDCQGFWRSMGGDGCHTAVRGETTNTEMQIKMEKDHEKAWIQSVAGGGCVRTNSPVGWLCC